MNLVPIGETGELPDNVQLGKHLQTVVRFTVEFYARSGFAPPWIGYIGIDDHGAVGTCGFKSAPAEGRVEIAYATNPGQEGRGVATAMASKLIELVRDADDELTVFAQTLPAESASTSILKRLGFHRTGAVEHPEDGMVWEWELP